MRDYYKLSCFSLIAHLIVHNHGGKMTTASAVDAQERKKAVESALVKVLQSREARIGMDGDELVHNVKKLIPPNVEINQAILETFLAPFLSDGRVAKRGKFYLWNHQRSLCGIIINGFCKCCGNDVGLLKECSFCNNAR
jgi:hypothetical protein